MASSDTLCFFDPLSNQPPSGAFATLNQRNSEFILEFQSTPDSSAIWRGVLPNHYAANGITATIVWCASGATANNCKWNIAFERNQDGTDTIVGDSFATSGTVTSSPPGTAGIFKYSTIAFANTAIDGLLKNEVFRIKLTRDTSVASNMAGSAQVVAVFLQET